MREKRKGHYHTAFCGRVAGRGTKRWGWREGVYSVGAGEVKYVDLISVSFWLLFAVSGGSKGLLKTYGLGGKGIRNSD